MGIITKHEHCTNVLEKKAKKTIWVQCTASFNLWLVALHKFEQELSFFMIQAQLCRLRRCILRYLHEHTFNLAQNAHIHTRIHVHTRTHALTHKHTNTHRHCTDCWTWKLDSDNDHSRDILVL
jgi:hypothetical protein